MLTRNEILSMYKTRCLISGIPVPYEVDEQHFLDNISKENEDNDVVSNQYVHYVGFVAGVETMFAKIGGQVEKSPFSERLVGHYARIPEL